MNPVDFYVLPADDRDSRWLFAARLADKVRRLGHRLYIAVDDAEQARALDDFLWARPEDSFLPHRRADDHEAPPAPVEIGHGGTPPTPGEVLINLSASVPEGFERFERLAEIVVQAPDVLKSTREHFRFYKSRGYPVRHRQL